MNADIEVQDWGLLPYTEALLRQKGLADARFKGSGPDTVVIVEHPSTITLGRHCSPEDILVDSESLLASGIAVERSDRGGRATYHGPGQIVVYPVVGIVARGLGARGWVELLETALLETLAEFGASGRRICGNPGIWAPQGKIASLGLRIKRGVSYHGVSINVDLDVSPFGNIVTCGAPAERISSLALEAGQAPPPRDVGWSFARRLIDQLPSIKR